MGLSEGSGVCAFAGLPVMSWAFCIGDGVVGLLVVGTFVGLGVIGFRVGLAVVGLRVIPSVQHGDRDCVCFQPLVRILRVLRGEHSWERGSGGSAAPPLLLAAEQTRDRATQQALELRRVTARGERDQVQIRSAYQHALDGHRVRFLQSAF